MPLQPPEQPSASAQSRDYALALAAVLAALLLRYLMDPWWGSRGPVARRHGGRGAVSAAIAGLGQGSTVTVLLLPLAASSG